ncbi:MAG: NADH-quinone oxidoreductase subunit NuoK [Pirellulaceae bacterium]|jgi:NADH-quinone oxidoreductase subunit K|nr:NADH-quinone oxidoreductase subunit NuoK [Pirellulaceae bacterium]MDP6553862.1 NADH-quinone oxidoreductase subunit NuoK [Pirellulaceae bacterium]MDP6718443.1 NADH-quinone oxidoreductase subunit NuoK [Pirellulaceae bacterium]
MNESALLYNYLLIGGVLFALGLIGFVVRRNMIVMFLCAEMMLQGVSVSLVAWSRYHDDWGGQMLVLFIIAVAAAEAGIALALILMLFHQSGSLDMAFWQDLREDDQPAFVDHKPPDDDDRDRIWPTLTPAGIEPEVDPDEQMHRSKI